MSQYQGPCINSEPYQSQHYITSPSYSPSLYAPSQASPCYDLHSPPLTSTTYYYTPRHLACSETYNNSRFQTHDLSNHGMVSLRNTCFPIKIESQDSDFSELSEPVSYPERGLPSPSNFDGIIRDYIHRLNEKKKDKALVQAHRAGNIKKVLLDPKTTVVGTPQFRFWARKMFKLGPDDARIPPEDKLVYNSEKPVAVQEKIYKILYKAHLKCQHGGRDKTSNEVRNMYSWIPKELISSFVKACPTCVDRRNPNHRSLPKSMGVAPISDTSSESTPSPTSQMLYTSPESRCDSRRESVEQLMLNLAATPMKMESPVKQHFPTLGATSMTIEQRFEKHILPPAATPLKAEPPCEESQCQPWPSELNYVNAYGNMPFVNTSPLSAAQATNMSVHALPVDTLYRHSHIREGHHYQ